MTHFRRPALFLLSAGLVLLTGCSESGYRWQIVSGNVSGSGISFRGIAAVNASVCWVSGSGGAIVRTTDGGKNWQRFSIPGTDSLDFRDIEAFGPDTAVVMSIGTGSRSRIYRTVDGGRNWELVNQNSYGPGFYDAIAFWDENRGILQGDPIDNRLYILVTEDGGKNWQEIPPEQMPVVEEGEYAFAASGSHLIATRERDAWIGTGGAKARVFHSSDYGKTWHAVSTPMIQGIASAGIFSIAFKDESFGIAVGGDYTRENEGTDNVIYTGDAGKSWNLWSGSGAHGHLDFRSSIRYAGGIFITVGPSGSEYSADGATRWITIEGPGFHTLSVGTDGIDAIWAAGPNGTIGKLVRN